MSTKSAPVRQFDRAHAARLLLSAVVMAVGTSVLIGWFLHVERLKTVVTGLTTMKANTAVALVAGGLSVALVGSKSRPVRLMSASAAILVFTLGVLTLAEYIFGFRLGIDELVISDPDTTSRPFNGRMSPATATAFLGSGIALILLARGRSNGAVLTAHVLASVPAAVGLLALTGYAYGVERLYSFGPFVTVALHTGVALFLLSAAVLVTRPSEGWEKQFLGRPIARSALLQISFLSLVVTFLVGLIVVWGVRRGLYAAAYAPALFAIATAGALIWLAFRSARILALAEGQLLSAQRSATQNEGQFLIFTQTVPNHVWAARPDGYLDWFNAQVYAYSGDAPGTLDGSDTWARIVHPDDLPAAGAAWVDALKTGEVYETQFRIRRSDGEYRWFLVRAEAVRDAQGAIIRWVGTNTDVDDTRRQAVRLAELNDNLAAEVDARTSQLMAAEAQLRQAQKMEAVGQLTGGIAHDFNNLLTGVAGSLEMIRTRIAQGRYDAIDRYLHTAEGAAKRAASLTQRLLAFSRRQTLDPKPTDVNRLVLGMENIIRHTVGPSIEIEIVGAGGLWSTLVDPGQLDNALLNLCINARDAMPDGGRLTIETANKWLDERAAAERDLAPGQYVTLCVSDTGTGMTPEVAARAFDPFFTTKPMGSGTGLGLSMIYGFVRQSGGQVRIYSELGHGTTICLYFARHMAVPETTTDLAPATLIVAGARNEVVLVVDDEPAVRMLVTEVLEDAGYAWLEAQNGAEAISIIESQHRIDLLITDIGLPGGMNGRQIADAARVLKPEIKVLFITGYAENAVIGNGQLDPGMELVTKPFSMDALGIKVDNMLDQLRLV